MDKNANLKKAHFYKKSTKKHLLEKKKHEKEKSTKKEMCFLKGLCTTPANIFILTITKSTFSYISDTNVWISNLCPCIFLFPTWILWILDANSGKECKD